MVINKCREIKWDLLRLCLYKESILLKCNKDKQALHHCNQLLRSRSLASTIDPPNRQFQPSKISQHNTLLYNLCKVSPFHSNSTTDQDRRCPLIIKISLGFHKISKSFNRNLLKTSQIFLKLNKLVQQYRKYSNRIYRVIIRKILSHSRLFHKITLQLRWILTNQSLNKMSQIRKFLPNQPQIDEIIEFQLK